MSPVCIPPIDPQRRQFIKATAAASIVAGVGPWLVSCGITDDTDDASYGDRDVRTHYFDLSNADSNSRFYLVVGTRHHPIEEITPEQRAVARSTIPELQQVSDSSITHAAIDIPLPAANIQMLYVKGVSQGSDEVSGSWSMHQMYYHIPSTAVAAVSQALEVSKRESYARQEAQDTYSYCTDPANANYVKYINHAVALVCHHPEIGCMDPATLSYVQQNIICRDATIQDLAVSLSYQGPATTSGGWATLVEYLDPDTGQTVLDSQGHTLYFTQHSAETLRLTGAAIRSVLPKVKNDPVLGANITGKQPTADNTDLKGKLWVVNNGTPTRTALNLPSSRTLRAMAQESVAWTATDISYGSGFSLENVSGNSSRIVTFSAHNWYCRYLGVYIRYLDGDSNPIPISSLPSETRSQFNSELSGTYDGFLTLMNQELLILGIPVKSATQSFSVTIPEMAAGLQILAGGLGSGSQDYPETVLPGTVMTVVLDLAVPGIFLAMAASTAYASFCGTMSTSTGLLLSTAQLFIQAIADSVLVGIYGDTDATVYMNLVSPLAGTLLKSAKALAAEITASLEEGEAEGIALDCIPFGIGLVIQAVMAAGTAAQIAETSAEVANAPWTYATEVKATHDLTVTVSHDPLDVAGFPAVATHYRLFAVCDGSSPYDSGAIQMPATTQTDPLSYTFTSLPSGGKVNVSVAFYSQNGWLAGAGSTGPIDNIEDTAAITIKENLVPLNASTVYGHKQKIVLDASGHHVWQATEAPPFDPSQSFMCANTAGQLCDLTGITLNEHFGAIGYSWMAYSSGVNDVVSGANGQLHQFANISFTQNPQAGYFSADVGSRLPLRLAYDRTAASGVNYYIDSSSSTSIVRQIVLEGVDMPPTVDLPGSNQAVGRFNLASDGFAVHPTGKLISINTEYSKIEVLHPLSTPVADSDAPLAQSYSGPGTREGLINGPACIAVTPGGALLVVEQANNQIQAFDTGANPTRIFAGGSSSIMPLRSQSDGATFLDIAMEFVGYVYILYKTTYNDHVLDIYDPDGGWVCSTSGLNAGKMTLDLFRSLYTLNYEVLTPVGAVTEPSVSQWIPST